MNKKLVIPKSVLIEANNQAIQIIKPKVEDIVTNEFESIKQEMIMEFLNHPVTQEIKAGAGANNISNTLGRGNLFSFIGFQAGENPTDVIVEILESCSIKFYSRKRGDLVASITIPSSKSIFAATPMPWASGRSWAKGIESGISGLGFYLQKNNAGRSEGGVQSNSKIFAQKFKPTTYISSLLNKYYKKFQNISSTKLIIK